MCRVLVAEDGSAYLEYVVSVGPYKIDVPAVHPLTPDDFAAFENGTLDLGVMARNLAEQFPHTDPRARKSVQGS